MDLPADFCLPPPLATELDTADVLLVDTVWEVPLLLAVVDVVLVGNSLLPGCTGHNLSEAAVAGCAVLTGQYLGHYGAMAQELNQASLMAAEETAAIVRHTGNPQLVPPLIG